MKSVVIWPREAVPYSYGDYSEHNLETRTIWLSDCAVIKRKTRERFPVMSSPNWQIKPAASFRDAAPREERGGRKTSVYIRAPRAG